MDKISLQVEINGVSTEIKNINQLKDAIKKLDNEAGNAEFGSDEFKKASSESQKLKDSLKQLSDGGMKPVSNAMSELKSQIKQAKSELAQFDPGTEKYEQARKKLAELNDKLGDVGDAAKIQGNGIERLGASFGLLREGLQNADFDKAKLAFKGLGDAMKAVPIFLIIEGLKYLMDNFDKIVEFIKPVSSETKALTKNLELQKVATAQLTSESKAQQAILEAQLGLMQEQGKSNDDILAQQEKIFQAKKKGLEASVAELQASIKLNSYKLAEIRANDDLTESYYRLMAAGLRKVGLDKDADNIDKLIAQSKLDRSKEVNDQLAKDSQGLLDLKAQIAALEINQETSVLKAKHDANKKDQDEALKDYQDYMDAQYEAYIRNKQAEEDGDTQSQMLADQERKDQLANETNDIRTEEQIRLDITAQAEEERTRKHQEEVDKRRSAEKNAITGSLALAQATNNSLQQLSDAYFMFKMKTLQKGSAAELRAAEQQFKINKALSISSAIISGIQGVINALSAQSVIPEPYGTILKVINAAAVGVAAGVNVAKIASTQFNPGTSGGGGGTVGAPVSLPPPPTISTTSNNVSGTKFDENGNTINNNQPLTANVHVKADVVESDMTNKQQQMATLKSQATF